MTQPLERKTPSAHTHPPQSAPPPLLSLSRGHAGRGQRVWERAWKPRPLRSLRSGCHPQLVPACLSELSYIRLQPDAVKPHCCGFCLVAELCLTLLWPVDCSLSVRGVSPARTLERVAVPFSRGSSRRGDQTRNRRARTPPFPLLIPGAHTPHCCPLASPAFRQDAHSGLSLWTREGCCCARSMPPPPQTSLRSRLSSGSGQGGTVAHKMACQAAEPKPALGNS